MEKNKPGGFAGVIASEIMKVVVWKLNRKAFKEDKNDSAITRFERALCVILLDRIKWLGRDYISKGCISTEDLRDLMEMHNCYHDDLNGNGFLDNVVKQVKV